MKPPFEQTLWCFIGICAGMVLTLVLLQDKGYHPQTDEHVIYEDDYFHLDYQIDLKQDRYIVIDEHGERTDVEIGELEEFFIDDNQ